MSSTIAPTIIDKILFIFLGSRGYYALRILMILIIKAITVDSKITGSASMKTGSCPYVSETRVDDNRIRHIPDDRIVSPVLSVCFMRAIVYAARQMTAPIKGYKSNALRDIVPAAFPSRSKCAGKSSDREFHLTAIAKAFKTTITLGITQPRLFI